MALPSLSTGCLFALCHDQPFEKPVYLQLMGAWATDMCHACCTCRATSRLLLPLQQQSCPLHPLPAQ